MAMLKNYLLMLMLGTSVLALPACNDDDDPVPPLPSGEEHPYSDDIVTNGVILYGSIKGDRTFSADSVYYLDGYVFVESGELTIEPGTVIMGFEQPSNAQNPQWKDSNGNKSEGAASSLIITREATINAAGTAENPIIFTSAEDQEALGGALNLSPADSKLWAGLIILGKAPVYSNGDTETQVEGIPDGEDRALFGGNDENHNSGVLTYVSIRFTGADIGDGDEIQGLTLGGVGRGTTIQNIDIFVSGDDGIEIFGGTVNIKNLSVAFAEDDAFDFDLGWSGFGQYLFGLQRADDGDHGGEWDGASPEDAPLYTTARLYNMTLIGQGSSGGRGENLPAILIREGGALSIYNSIITDFNGKGIEVQDSGNPESSYNRIVNEGMAELAGNTWWTLNASSIAEMVVPTSSDDFNPGDPDASGLIAYLEADNTFADPMLTGISRENESNGLDPRPADSGFPVSVSEPSVENTPYAGAFEPGAQTWLAGWSALSRFGILSE